jgi:hypothetical protein
MKVFTVLLASMMMFAPVVHAAETVGEKAAVTGKKIKRSAKKGMNRVKEAVCMEGDVECAAKKLKNRASEAKDGVVDKATEVKDNVD